MEKQALDYLSTLSFENFVQFLITVIFVIILFVFLKGLSKKFFELIGFEPEEQRRIREDHELLVQTVHSLATLTEKQLNDTHQSIVHDNQIKEDLACFMDDMRKSISEITDEQKEMGHTLVEIVESNKARDNATMEEMCDRISQKTRYYINDLNGIPEDEYDDFVRMYNAYRGIGGNHGAEAKYNYCIKHLEIIPVQKKIKKTGS